MTRYEIHVDRLVAHDLLADRAHALAMDVETRLAALARGDAGPSGPSGPSGPRATGDDLADRVAAEVWRQVGRAREVRR